MPPKIAPVSFENEPVCRAKIEETDGWGVGGEGEGAGLSHDEIVFDEVRYREPVRSRRPDRDRRCACLAYEVPGPGDLPIFLDLAAADAIERHALRDTSVELGGILLGKECVDDETGEPFVWVTRSLEAKHYENTQASFTYTHESWEEITRERDQKFPDLDIVGWYHTHPDFGIFLSHHDLFIQQHFFGQPLQVAYVVDPIRQTRGFFRWRGGEMEPTGGYYLTADRGQRLALARLANDLENLPNADPAGGLGGLSPRLEAELIAMLSRPATYAHRPPVADRAQSLMVFALFGALFGMLALSAVLWLSALSGHVAEQTKAVDELRKTVAETADRQRAALDLALGGSAGTSTDKELRRLVRERDEAKGESANQKAVNDLLVARTREQEGELKELRAKYEKAKEFEKDAEEVANLRARVADLSVFKERQARSIDELESILKTPEGQKAAARAAQQRRVWYAAVAGWVVSGVLALALAGGYVYYHLPPSDEAEDRPPVG